MRGVIFADANFVIFCILRRFISKDVCSVILGTKKTKEKFT